MTGRRLLLILLSPVLAIVGAVSLLLGLSFFSGNNPATVAVGDIEMATVAGERLIYLLARCLLLPFQLIFIGMALVVALWIFRRRHRIASWVLGEPLTERLSGSSEHDLSSRIIIGDERRRTWHQLLSSMIALAAIIGGFLLILGQFVSRSDLGVIVTALTGSLAWGARLPISDLLGGISGIFENNYKLGDRIQYKQIDKVVEGIVEHVDLRFVSVRADSGELVTIPHGELRIFRNKSAGESKGVYVTFPIRTADISRAVELLEQLALESVTLVPSLIEPWHVLSREGQMGATTNVSNLSSEIKNE